MRKITEQAAAAFMADRPFKKDNTQVEVMEDVTIMRLFGHGIAFRNPRTGEVTITNFGYFTVTTKERLNGIPGVDIRQKNGEWYLNGEPWDGHLINV